MGQNCNTNTLQIRSHLRSLLYYLVIYIILVLKVFFYDTVLLKNIQNGNELIT